MSDYPSVSEMLVRLGFVSEWWEYGFLDDESLQSLYGEYQTSHDKNTEHYRYGAFLRSLEKDSLTKNVDFAEAYTRLCQLDPDLTMAKSALESLLRSFAITLEQVKALKMLPEFSDFHLQLAAERRLSKL